MKADRPPQPGVSKGETTRKKIVQEGLRRASALGLEGLTIGDLASSMGLSKSGLFAHFKSKEKLQLAVLEAAAEDFTRRVFQPAIQQPRGLPRLRALLRAWMDWSRAPQGAGGCVFIAGAMEWDDRPGPVRDAIVSRFQQLLSNLERAVRLCVTEGHLRPDTAVDLVTAQLHGIVLKHHLDSRLLRLPQADRLAELALEQVLRPCLDPHEVPTP